MGFLFNSMGLLYNQILSRTQFILFIIGSILSIYLGAEEAVFSENRYENPYTIHLLSFIGTLFILLLSNRIGKIRFVSYVGRYSLIVLCTHLFFIRIFYHLFHSVINSVSILFVLCSIFTIFFLLFDYFIFFEVFTKICCTKGFLMCEVLICV